MEMSTSERTSPESKGGKIAWASEPNPRRARHHRHMDLLPPVDLESLSTLLHEEEPRNGTDSQSYHHLYEEGREQSCELSTTDFGSSVSQKIALYSSSLESIHYTSSFRDLGIPQRNLQSLFSETSKDSVWWLDVQNPSEKDLRLLCDTFHIHPLTFEDIWTQETREKFEDFPSYYFACFRSFHVVESESQTSFEPYTIYVIALRGGTLSFRFTESCHGTNVQERIKLLKDHVSISSAWICYALV
jgi:Mg2+ and Co2+ transporter CorA